MRLRVFGERAPKRANERPAFDHRSKDPRMIPFLLLEGRHVNSVTSSQRHFARCAMRPRILLRGVEFYCVQMTSRRTDGRHHSHRFASFDPLSPPPPPQPPEGATTQSIFGRRVKNRAAPAAGKGNRRSAAIGRKSVVKLSAN
jgi:hypothetical protein